MHEMSNWIPALLITGAIYLAAMVLVGSMIRKRITKWFKGE